MRKNYPLFVNSLAMVTLLVGLVGCAAPATPAPTPAPTDMVTDIITDTGTTTGTVPGTADGAAPADEQLANATYPIDLTPSGLVTLENGEYSEPIVAGSASMLTVTMGQVAYGDLNGDGVDDAAVILNSDSGGSGTNVYLSAVLTKDGESQPVTSALIGDRVQVNSLAIADEVITLEMVTQGPNDPMCCPTQVVTNTYQLEGDQLVLASTTAPE